MDKFPVAAHHLVECERHSGVLSGPVCADLHEAVLDMLGFGSLLKFDIHADGGLGFLDGLIDFNAEGVVAEGAEGGIAAATDGESVEVGEEGHVLLVSDSVPANMEVRDAHFDFGF